MEANISRSDRFEFEIREATARWRGPFRWGKDDCLIALADIYRSVIGIDLAAAYRGRYRSEKGAARVLGRRGVPGALAGAARRMGYVSVPQARAKTGGLGMAATPGGPTGVIRYREFWIGRADGGVRSFPADQIIRAWDKP